MSCVFCDFSNAQRIVRENDYCYAIVPDKPAMFGHLMVVSKKIGTEHAVDITSPTLSETQLTEMIREVRSLARALLKLEFRGKRVKKVYVLTQCETPHFHFHLKLRFEGEGTGDAFLYEKELEEARWLSEGEEKAKLEYDGLERIKWIRLVLDRHSNALRQHTWVRGDEERKRFVNLIMTEAKKVLLGQNLTSQYGKHQAEFGSTTVS